MTLTLRGARKGGRRGAIRSPDLYREVFDRHPHGLFLLNADLQVIGANASGCALLQRERDEVIGRRIHEFFRVHEMPRNAEPHHPDWPHHWDLITKTGGAMALDVRLQPLAGRCYVATCRPVLPAPSGLHAGMPDPESLTFERARAFQEAQQLAQVGSWEWDIVHDRAQWTDEMYRIMGLVPQSETMTRRQYLNRVHPRDRRKLIEATVKHWAHGTPLDVEHRIVRPDGSVRFCRARGQIHRNAARQIVRMTGTLQDITEVRRVETVLRESEQRLRAAMSATMDAILIFAVVRGPNDAVRDFRLTEANARFFEMLVAKPANPAGKCLSELIPSIWSERLVRRFADVVTTGHGWTENFNVTLREVRAEWVQVNVAPLGDGLLITVRDISENKRAEALLKELPRRVMDAEENERRRVARELHDGVGQALASVRYQLHGLASAGLAPVPAQLAMPIAALDEAMRELRRIAHGLRPGALDDFGLEAALRDLVAEFRKRVQVTVVCRFLGDNRQLAPQVADAFYRISQEALTNIERHARATRVRVSLTCTAARATLRISDNGRGLESATGPRRNAVSMGLRHMRERALLAGGTFALRSVPGSGTTLAAQFSWPANAPAA